MNFFPLEQHRQIYLQLSLNLKAIISQRLVRKDDGSRVAAVEVLLASPRVRDLIYRGEVAEIKEAMEKSSTIGMQTFDQHLFELFHAGKVSIEEALRNADSANNLRLRIKLAENPSLEEPASPFSPKPQPESTDESMKLRVDEQ